MHELGIVFHIIDAVEKIVADNGLSEVSVVTLELGEVSAILPEYLTDCWNWAVKKTEHLKACRLETEQIPAVTVCEDCEKTYSTVLHGKICPFCQSPQTHLVTGNEVLIKQIEAM